MAKRKSNDGADSEALSNPASAPEQPTPKTELPDIGSPSISPAKIESAVEPAAVQKTPGETSDASAAASETSMAAEETTPAAIPDIKAPQRPRFALRPRHKRYALLAASVAIAAAFGAIVGAAATGGFSKPKVDAAVEDSKVTQQSVARLAKEISNLKASLDAANKSAHSQIAKISERLNRETAEATGSIAQPQTAPAATASAPMPTPRPATTAEAQPPRRPIVADWSISLCQCATGTISNNSEPLLRSGRWQAAPAGAALHLRVSVVASGVKACQISVTRMARITSCTVLS
jgi:hypothetical protein